MSMSGEKKIADCFRHAKTVKEKLSAIYSMYSAVLPIKKECDIPEAMRILRILTGYTLDQMEAELKE